MQRRRRAFLGSLAALVGAGCLQQGADTEGSGGGRTTSTSTTPATDGSTTTTTPATTTSPGSTTTDDTPTTDSTTSPGTTTPESEVSIAPESALEWQRSFDADVALGPAVADGTLYVGTADGTLHALAPNGDVRWRATVGGSFFAGSGDDHSPIVADGTVYLTSGSQSGAHGDDYAVYAIDAATGGEQWSSTVDYPKFLSLLAVAGGRVYTATSDDMISGSGETLAAHDAATGERAWTVEVGDPQAAGASSDAIAVADYDGLQVVDADGSVRWRSETYSEMAPRSPVFAGDHLLAATDRSASGLYALDPATGDRRWSHTDAFVNSLAVGDRAYVGGETVTAYEFDGSRAWDAGVEAFVDRVHGDTVYGGTFSDGGGGGAVAFATDDGSERWRYDAEGEIASVAALDSGIAAVTQQGVAVVDGVDPATGTRTIRFAAGDRRGLSTPAVHESTVYVANGSALYALA